MDPLTSPTKARQAASKANDWAYVCSWLKRQYHPHHVPPFERNDDVLNSLLALVAANTAADRESEILHRARDEELTRSQIVNDVSNGGEASPCSRLMDQIESSMDAEGQRALGELTETSVLLGTLSTNVVALAEGIMEVTEDGLDVEMQLRKARDLQAHLDQETRAVRSRLETLYEDQAQASSERLQQQTSELGLHSKEIALKLVEYKTTIAGLGRNKIEGTTMEDLKVEERDIKRRQERVTALEKQILNFGGLPPDLESSKVEYRRAQGDLQELVRRRDELFEALVIA